MTRALHWSWDPTYEAWKWCLQLLCQNMSHNAIKDGFSGKSKEPYEYQGGAMQAWQE